MAFDVPPPTTLAEIRLQPDPGLRRDHFLRVLGLEVGQLPGPEILEQARRRLLEQPGVRNVRLSHVGPELVVTLELEPRWSGSAQVLPPITPLGLAAGADHARLGVLETRFRLQAGHAWDFQPAYGDLPLAEYPNLFVGGEAGLWLTGQLSASLMMTHILPSDERSSPTWIRTLGPVVRYDDTDLPPSPRSGIRWRWDSRMGWLDGGPVGSFWTHQGEWGRFVPWGESVVLTTVTAGFGRGDLPWYHRFQAGVAWPFRGLMFRRFVGDQLLVLGLELRRPLLSNLWPGWWPPIGLTGATFGNVGRVWNRGGQPLFPDDWRIGVGGYLGLSLGNWHVGRLEATVGSEGGWIGLVNGWPLD